MKEKILKLGRDFFTPPIFAHDEKNQAARQVFPILWFHVLIILIIAAVLIILSPGFVRFWLALALSTIAINLLLIALTRSGRMRLASILLVGQLWLQISVLSWITSGFGSRAAWGYFIVVFIAGMLLGRLSGIITAVWCSISTLLLALASPMASSDPARFWLINSFYLLLVLMLQNLASRSIRESLQQARLQLLERQQVESALVQSERRYREMVNSLPFCIFEMDLDGRIRFVNQAGLEWFGYSEVELLSGMNAFQLLPDLDENRARDNLQRLMSGKEIPFSEYQVRCKDGSLFSVLIRTRLLLHDGQPVALQGSLIDNRERKRAEEALRTSSQFTATLLRAIPLAVFFKDKAGRYTGCNDAFTEFLGVTSDEIRGKMVHELWPGDLAETYHRKDLELMQAGQHQVYEYQVKDKHGQLRPVIFAKDVFLDASGEVGGMVGAFLDITNRKQAEEALRESEQRYRTLFEAASDSIFVMKDNLFFDCNSRTLEMFACTRQQIIGVSPDRFSPPLQPDGRNSREKALEKIAAAYGGVPQFFEWMHCRADGTPFITEVSLNCFELGAGPHLLAIVRDIGGRKVLEEQLRQAQKMEAVGILAGGVAHDFNNILSTIVGYASLLQMQDGLEAKLKEYLERILASTERAASLTHSLLAFSRKQAIDLQPVDINDAIYGFHKVLARLIGEDIDFRVSLASESLVVDADIRQIEQVLMNLASNSRDAMPHGGTLLITTRVEVAKKGKGEMPGGSYAVISVSDNGTGMDKEIQDHLFEPFFTTKDVGKGTGLGLAIVYGIIKNHKGFIHMESTATRGTTFQIYLPLKLDAVLKSRHKIQKPIPRGSETILLVEDDAAVRHATRSMLEEFGYTVLEAEDGQDALTVFERHAERVRLLLSDLIMPKMNGMETQASLLKVKPDLKTIFMSGYTSDIIARKGIYEPGMHLLLKPLHPAALLEKVREVLDD